MYKVNVISHFAGAHHLNSYDGDCKDLHGHNWKVRVQLGSKVLDNLGMAMDFKLVKKHLNTIISSLDHKYLNELHWFKNMNPTSENISRIIFEELVNNLKNENIRVLEIEVWESETTSIIYSPCISQQV
jgi:6-pyruvoyltetrahydropterin/6-carboxytetrahydropterin synthase